MSFDHKAYEFDWTKFEVELGPVLRAALETGDASVLEYFLQVHVTACKNPYDGTPLDNDWREQLSVGDIQEIGDFALTKYYEPSDDFGLHESWVELSSSLSTAQQKALLGQAFGPLGTPFDPGRQGSYLQPPLMVAESLDLLTSVPNMEIRTFRGTLSAVVKRMKGVYVTF